MTGTCSIMSPFMLIPFVEHLDNCCLLPIIINSVFEQFILSLFESIHFLTSTDTFSKLIIASSSASGIFRTNEFFRMWSYAKPNMSISLWGISHRVLIYARKNFGPEELPCETENSKFLREEYAFRTMILQVRSRKKDDTQFRAVLLIPNRF